MATSNQSQFNPDIGEILEEAFERVGRDGRAGYDLVTARRSLNLVFQDIQNRGIGLWTVEQATLSLVAGTQTYALDADTMDVMPDAVTRRSGIDQTCTRIMRDEWLTIPNKTSTGRPIQFFVERLRDGVDISFWPTPSAADSFIYWRIRHIEDAKAGDETVDLPRRLVPAVISGLAWNLAEKAPELVSPERRAEMKLRYMEELKVAMEEDHDRASLYIRPAIIR